MEIKMYALSIPNIWPWVMMRLFHQHRYSMLRFPSPHAPKKKRPMQPLIVASFNVNFINPNDKSRGPMIHSWIGEASGKIPFLVLCFCCFRFLGKKHGVSVSFSHSVQDQCGFNFMFVNFLLQILTFDQRVHVCQGQGRAWDAGEAA